MVITDHFSIEAVDLSAVNCHRKHTDFCSERDLLRKFLVHKWCLALLTWDSIWRTSRHILARWKCGSPSFRVSISAFQKIGREQRTRPAGLLPGEAGWFVTEWAMIAFEEETIFEEVCLCQNDCQCLTNWIFAPRFEIMFPQIWETSLCPALNSSRSAMHFSWSDFSK
jgi:hypothetical protein